MKLESSEKIPLTVNPYVTLLTRRSLQSNGRLVLTCSPGSAHTEV
jgi:hypothetical protein